MTDTKIGCVQHDCAKCKALEAQVNTCGSGAGCLHKDARIEALEAQLAAEQAQPEPVYQYQLASGNWIDQSKESHDYNARHGQATLRTVYTAVYQGGAA